MVSVSCRVIGYHWLDIQESWLGDLSTERYDQHNVKISVQTNFKGKLQVKGAQNVIFNWNMHKINIITQIIEPTNIFESCLVNISELKCKIGTSTTHKLLNQGLPWSLNICHQFFIKLPVSEWTSESLYCQSFCNQWEIFVATSGFGGNGDTCEWQMKSYIMIS